MMLESGADSGKVLKLDSLLSLFEYIATTPDSERIHTVRIPWQAGEESPRMKRKPLSTSKATAEEEPENLYSSDDIDYVFEKFLVQLKKEEVDLYLATTLVLEAHEVFKREGCLIDLDFSESGEEIETIVVGDIHGQFKDLVYIFEKFGRPSHNRRYIFNGDIVDRGPRSIACWLFLCAIKIAVPEYIYITRGNHESRTVSFFGSTFAQECSKLYTSDFYMLCQQTFDELPLSYVLNKSIFITHGGLPQDLCLETLRKTPKRRIDINCIDKTVMALLWNDPGHMCGYGRNDRGPNVFTFGPDVTNRFLQKHKLSLLIRSHQHQHFGHSYMHSGKCLTIFSSPNYQYMGNSGAVAIVDTKGNVKVEQFE